MTSRIHALVLLILSSCATGAANLRAGTPDVGTAHPPATTPYNVPHGETPIDCGIQWQIWQDEVVAYVKRSGSRFEAFAHGPPCVITVIAPNLSEESFEWLTNRTFPVEIIRGEPAPPI
jgi:hypothetical protein